MEIQVTRFRRPARDKLPVYENEEARAVLAYLVENLVLVGQLDILLEEVAFPVQLLRLPPVIKGACDEDFVGFGMFPRYARQLGEGRERSRRKRRTHHLKV